ncbi:hypothetical protein Btru_016595 [Bulinus truncatus]|nr:hypothetical protein Btru_016595 [Bulinus truncatus]
MSESFYLGLLKRLLTALLVREYGETKVTICVVHINGHLVRCTSTEYTCDISEEEAYHFSKEEADISSRVYPQRSDVITEINGLDQIFLNGIIKQLKKNSGFLKWKLDLKETSINITHNRYQRVCLEMNGIVFNKTDGGLNNDLIKNYGQWSMPNVSSRKVVRINLDKYFLPIHVGEGDLWADLGSTHYRPGQSEQGKEGERTTSKHLLKRDFIMKENDPPCSRHFFYSPRSHQTQTPTFKCLHGNDTVNKSSSKTQSHNRNNSRFHIAVHRKIVKSVSFGNTDLNYVLLIQKSSNKTSTSKTSESPSPCCHVTSRPKVTVKHLQPIKSFSAGHQNPHSEVTISKLRSQILYSQSDKEETWAPYAQQDGPDVPGYKYYCTKGDARAQKRKASKNYETEVEKTKCPMCSRNVSKSTLGSYCQHKSNKAKIRSANGSKPKNFNFVFGMNVYASENIRLNTPSMFHSEFPHTIKQSLLQQLIVNGDLPCSKEEAATLAGIQLHIEEAWPESGDEDDEELGIETPNHQNNNCRSPTNGLAGDEEATDQTRCFRINTETEKMENLKHKKELIRSHRAHRITSTRRSTKLARSLLCTSDSEWGPREGLDLSRYLPPHYTTSKKVRELIEDKQKKLWHTPYYENEVKLKQLYIRICKNLPSYGCKLFQVKEILRGNTQKKVARMLAISNEKIMLLDTKTHLPAKIQHLKDMDDWLSGSGKAHDSLVLEFRGTKPWTLAMPSVECLKSVTAAIWEALDMDGRFLNNGALPRDSFEFDYQRKQLTPRPELEPLCQYTEELEGLRKMLHFPEEVAMMLTATEHKLFCNVPPQNYVRHVTMELSRPLLQKMPTSVEQLIQRFNEVGFVITGGTSVEQLISRFKEVVLFLYFVLYRNLDNTSGNVLKKRDTNPSFIGPITMENIAERLTIIIHDFEDFENSLVETTDLIKKALGPVPVLIVANRLPYPPVKLDSQSAKFITLQSDLDKNYTSACPWQFIDTQYVLMLPDGVKIRNLQQIMHYVHILLGKKITKAVAIPIREDNLSCSTLDFNYKIWTVAYYGNYSSSDNLYYCPQVNGAHALLMEAKNFKSLPEPFSRPFPLTFYVQAKTAGWKVKIAKGEKLEVVSKLYTDPHNNWKHKKAESERLASFYKTVGIKHEISVNKMHRYFGCDKDSPRCFGTIINDMPEYLYEGRWTPPCCLKALRETAAHVFKILENSNVRYWLEGGSLLGAARLKDIIPWDYDVDIGVYRDDIVKCHELLNAKSESYTDNQGFVWEKANEGDFYRVQYSAVNHLHVDIHPFYSKNGIMTKDTWLPTHRQDVEFPERYLQPLTTIEFAGIMANAPNNVKEFLELKFGDGVIDNPKFPNFQSPS